VDRAGNRRHHQAAKPAVGIEDAGHQREESRVGARLEDHGVTAGLDGLGLAALQRLIGRDFGEELRVDHLRILDPHRAAPAGAAPVSHAAGEDEPDVGSSIVCEEALRIRVAGRDVVLRDEAGADDALLLGKVDAVADEARAFERAVLDGFLAGAIHFYVRLRAEELGEVRIVVGFSGFGDGFITHLLKSGVGPIPGIG